MFNDNQKYRPQNVWDDVFGFLNGLAKDAVSLKSDLDFQSENRRVLDNPDLFEIIRRIGRTEERYSTEIKIYDAILAARNAVNPPPQVSAIERFMQMSNPYHAPTYNDHLIKHHRELSWLTERIPEFVAIKYGKEKGVDWVLDKFGEVVKSWFNKMNDPNRWWG
jgi:hypothetical protein